MLRHEPIKGRLEVVEIDRMSIDCSDLMHDRELIVQHHHKQGLVVIWKIVTRRMRMTRWTTLDLGAADSVIPRGNGRGEHNKVIASSGYCA